MKTEICAEDNCQTKISTISKSGLCQRCRDRRYEQSPEGKAARARLRKKHKESWAEKEKNRKKALGEEYKQHIREYRRSRPEATKIAATKYRKSLKAKQTREKPDAKLRERVRHRVWIALRKYEVKKEGSTVDNLGCSIPELRSHLEGQFRDGMTWENYGFFGWHIDHTIPLSSFDLSDPEELKKACHYTNLQPLWAEENLRKSMYSIEEWKKIRGDLDGEKSQT